MGKIGRKIAARCAAFESEVGYFSRSRRDLPYYYFPGLAELAEWCSILVIAVRAGPGTHHAVNADILKKLGEEKGWSVKENFMLLRAIITGSTMSPPLLESMVVFGKARSLDRMRRFLEAQKKQSSAKK